MPEKKQILSVRLPKMILSELDHYVDGVTFRNRAHAIHFILSEWLENRRKAGKGEQISILDIKPPKKGKGRKKE